MQSTPEALFEAIPNYRFLIRTGLCLIIFAIFCLVFFSFVFDSALIDGWENYRKKDIESNNIKAFVLKESLKFMVTVALVGGVALLFKAHIEKREKAADRRAIAVAKQEALQTDIRSFFARSVYVYNQIKHFRRIARRYAYRISNPTFKMDLKKYDDIITEMDKYQLEIEALKKEADRNPNYLGNESNQIKLCLQVSEKYINYIIKEYEKRKLIGGDAEGSAIFDHNHHLYIFIETGSMFRKRLTGRVKSEAEQLHKSELSENAKRIEYEDGYETEEEEIRKGDVHVYFFDPMNEMRAKLIDLMKKSSIENQIR